MKAIRSGCKGSFRGVEYPTFLAVWLGMDLVLIVCHPREGGEP